MNEFEARLEVINRMRDVLVSLSEVDPTPEEVDAMGDVAEILAEAIGLEVVGTDGPLIIAHLTVESE